MKIRVWIIALALLAAVPQPDAKAQGGRSVFRALGRALEGRGGQAALVAAGLTGAGVAGYETKAFVDTHMSDGEAVYSLQMDLDGNAHAIYWARWFSYPNITPMLQVEGDGDYLIPNYYPSFKGGSVLWNFKISKITGGRKINVILFDNAYDQNAVMNQFLRTKFDGELGPKISVWKGVKIKVGASGSFQILGSNDADLPIVQPSPICAYMVECPSPWFSSTWDTEGEMKDESGNVVGHIRMSQMLKK